MQHHDENEVLRDALAGLNEEVPPMPEGLHAAWMQQVEADTKRTQIPQKTAPRKRFTRFLSMAAAMAFVIGGTLLTRDDLRLGADSSIQQRAGGAVYGLTTANTMGAYDDVAESGYGLGFTMDEDAAAPQMRGARTANAPETEKKIIRTASLTLATKTYDATLATLRTACEGQGGWIESVSEHVNTPSGLRTAYLTLRVPQTGLDDYLASTDGLGRITYRSESAKDVTESYQDTQARLDTQLALMERLQALISESADLADLLALESQIAETQYEIDRLQSSLNSTDRKVSYATVSITLQEETTVDVTDATVTLGERIRAAITLGWKTLTGFAADALVFLVAAAPFIGIVLAAYIMVRIIKKVRK